MEAHPKETPLIYTEMLDLDKDDKARKQWKQVARFKLHLKFNFLHLLKQIISIKSYLLTLLISRITTTLYFHQNDTLL